MPTCASMLLPPPMPCRLYHPKSQPRTQQLRPATHQLKRILLTLNHHPPQYLQSNQPRQQPPIIRKPLCRILPSSLPTSQHHLSSHPLHQFKPHQLLHPPQPQYPTEIAQHWLMIKMSSIWRCATTHTPAFISRSSSRSTPVITPRQPPRARNVCGRSSSPSNATICRQTLAQTPSRLI